MRTKITMELSQPSLEKAKELVRDFREKYNQGLHDAIKTATEALYNKVISNCIAEGIHDELDAIHWEYNETSNVGRVWTNDWVIIFNEYGTGVKGHDNPHPKPEGWQYDVNNHGEEGWWYPSNSPHSRLFKDGVTRAWTKGLPARMMFYNAYDDIVKEFGNIVDIEIKKNIGNLYERAD